MPRTEIHTVGVIGAGTMGAGIAQVAAAGGCTVRLLDRDEAFVHKAIDGVRAQVQKAAERGKMPLQAAMAASDRLLAASSAEQLADCDLIIEAVFEDVAVKHAVLGAVERHTRPGAVFATNTSSLSVAEIGGGLRDASCMVGMHFFNPAPLMPLVEVIAAERSNAAAVEAVFRAAQAWGKSAVRARDVPGFIVNRVARPYYLEALRLLGDGIANIAQIDAAMKALGFKMGPFELMDLVGIDVNYAVSRSVHERLGRPERLAPHDIQRLMVESGTLGRKSGRGFYDYGGEKPQPIETRFGIRARSEAFQTPAIAAAAVAGPACGEIQTRILFSIFNEAEYALQERVATAADVDLAMVKGTNYPLGPIEWTDRIGRPRVREALRRWAASQGARYAPASAFA